MKFFLKSGFLTLLSAVFFLSGEWSGYLPFSPEFTTAGVFSGTGSFFVPVAPTGKKADKTHIPHYRVGGVACKGKNSIPFDCAQQSIQAQKTIKWGKLAPNSKKIAQDTLELLNTWRLEDVTKKRLLRSYLFYDVMGVMEWDFADGEGDGTPDLKKYPPLDGTIANRDQILKNFPGRKAFYDGSKFEVLTIKELKARAHAKWLSPLRGGHFAVLNGYVVGGFIDANGVYAQNDIHLLNGLKETDIRYLMETKPGAAFQVFSAPNCLGYGMDGDSALIEGMQYEPNQNIEAMLATMGGTIWRRYVEKPVDLLSEVTDKISSKKGLTVSDIDSIKIGVHENVTVTSGYYPPYSEKLIGEQKLDLKDPRATFLYDTHTVKRGTDPLMIFNKFIDYDKRPQVDQIFATVLNGSDRDKKILLKAAYLGTICAAAYLEEEELYLTLIGLQEGLTELEWIIEALEDADIIDMVRKSGLQVFIVVYPDLSVDRAFSPVQTKALFDAVDQLNKKIASQPASGGRDSHSEVEKFAQALAQMSEEEDLG